MVIARANGCLSSHCVTNAPRPINGFTASAVTMAAPLASRFGITTAFRSQRSRMILTPPARTIVATGPVIL
ncbi:hypothetical protein G6F59_018744 [Rhizopus arrhizus]|nr:hypothetical protein G6F59_018744 [Rhizopus arrhizus]